MWYVAIPCLVWKNSSTTIGSAYCVWKWVWIDAYWEKSFIVVAGGRGRWPVVVAVGRKRVAVGRWRVAGGRTVAAACGASMRAKYSLPVWAGRNVNQFFPGNEDASDFTMTWSWDAGTTYLLKSSLMVFHVVKWRRRSSSFRDFFSEPIVSQNMVSKIGRSQFDRSLCEYSGKWGIYQHLVPSNSAEITRGDLCLLESQDLQYVMALTMCVCVFMCVALVWGWSGMRLAKS